MRLLGLQLAETSDDAWNLLPVGTARAGEFESFMGVNMKSAGAVIKNALHRLSYSGRADPRADCWVIQVVLVADRRVASNEYEQFVETGAGNHPMCKSYPFERKLVRASQVLPHGIADSLWNSHCD